MGINFFSYLFDPNRRIYWLYLLSSFFIVLLWLFINKKKMSEILTKDFYESLRLDTYYFVLMFYIKAFVILPMIFSSKSIAFFVFESLVESFGFVRFNLSSSFVTIFYTFVLFICSDFSRYWLHRWLHTVGFLWEFHKVHHSPKALNPLSFYRIHPVESVLFGIRYSLVIGFVTGIFLYFFGAKVNIFEFMGVNVFVFFFSIIGGNLRHSPINLAYFKPLEYLFISPKQHQIHHDFRYMNKNYGGYIAFWDYIFNSHKLSDEVKEIKCGLPKNIQDEYKSVFSLIYKPFETNFRRYYEKLHKFYFFSLSHFRLF